MAIEMEMLLTDVRERGWTIFFTGCLVLQKCLIKFMREARARDKNMEIIFIRQIIKTTCLE